MLLRRLKLTVAAILGIAAAAVLFGVWVEVQGNRFLDSGTVILTTLDGFASKLAKKGSIEEYLAPTYSSVSLGLLQPELSGDRDGILSYEFVPDGSGFFASQAADEWRDYLASFASIQEVSLDLQRLEEWSGDRFTGIVRLEVLGEFDDARRVVDRFLFRLTTQNVGRPVLIKSLELLEGSRAVGDAPHFAEVGRQAGVAFRNFQYPGFVDEDLQFEIYPYSPAGITVADVDKDGFADLYIPDGIESKLFRNRRDGTFEDITEASGLDILSGVHVALIADYDNDGDGDFFIARSFERDQLFRNRGDGVFEEVQDSGLDRGCCTTGAAWADYDLDGDLDLYVCRYLDPRTDSPEAFYASNGQPNQLFRNDGPDQPFTNVTDEAGVGDDRLCLGTAFADFDGDRYPDIYVANDYGRNALFHNNGDGAFEDVTAKSKTLAYGAGMGATFGDYDNDGLLDIYVTNIRSKYIWFAATPLVRLFLLHSLLDGVMASNFGNYLEIMREWDRTFVGAFEQMASGNTLLHNRGDGTFEDRSWSSSANPPGWYWGAVLADLDNDGWQDIYAANGWIYQSLGTELELDFLTTVVSEQDLFADGGMFSMDRLADRSWHGYERNRHLRNRGNGVFEEIGWASGTDLIRNSRGVAVADFWNRGVLDLAVAAHRDNHALLRNQVGAKRNWLEVELLGVASNRDAVGALITITAEGRSQMREVSLGNGYASQSTLRQHFGLGTAAVASELRVFWPKTGQTNVFHQVPANQIVRLVEGQSTWTNIPPGQVGER